MAATSKEVNRNKVPKTITPENYPGFRLVHKDKVEQREGQGYIKVPGSRDGADTVKMFKPAKKE